MPDLPDILISKNSVKGAEQTEDSTKQARLQILLHWKCIVNHVLLLLQRRSKKLKFEEVENFRLKTKEGCGT